MSLRKQNGRLLCKYLALAENGDKEAAVLADLLAKKMFSTTEEDEENYQISILFPTGKRIVFNDFDEVVGKMQTDPNELIYYLETGKADQAGRKYESIVSDEMNTL